MNKTKDLVGATFRALGVSGLVASLGVVASGCLTAAVAGAAAYGGTKMAQPDNNLEEIRTSNTKLCYEENNEEICMCGGDLYRNNSNGYYLLRGYNFNPYSGEERINCTPSNTYCDECINGNNSRVIGFSSFKRIEISSWSNFTNSGVNNPTPKNEEGVAARQTRLKEIIEKARKHNREVHNNP